MRLIFCVDRNDGMAFNGRRQSRDRVIIADLAALIGENRLYLSPYSAPLFAGLPGVAVVPDPVAAAGAADFCFLEALPNGKTAADEIILYRFDRDYPADLHLDRALLSGLALAEKTELEGYSHKLIIREVYRK